MFNLSLSTFLGIIFRTVLVYLAVLVGLRLSGKREIGQMTVFDLVVVLEIDGTISVLPLGTSNTSVKTPVRFLRHK